MNTTKIIWTTKTWNPVSGCHSISAECKYCYARTIAEQKRGTVAFPRGFDVVIKPHKLNEPLRLKQPTLIFVNSMSDLFLSEIDDSYREKIIDIIHRCPQHIFQTLTKRPERAREFFSSRQVPPNLWLGVTCGGRQWLRRVDTLRQIDAPIRFISIEPMIEPIGPINLDSIDWVIVGGESGYHLCDPSICEVRGLVRKHRNMWVARDDRKDWVRDVRDQCVSKNVAFMLKQWGGARGDLAGREIDGVVWDQYPTHDRRHPFPANTTAV